MVDKISDYNKMTNEQLEQERNRLTVDIDNSHSTGVAKMGAAVAGGTVGVLGGGVAASGAYQLANRVELKAIKEASKVGASAEVLEAGEKAAIKLFEAGKGTKIALVAGAAVALGAAYMTGRHILNKSAAKQEEAASVKLTHVERLMQERQQQAALTNGDISR